MDERDPWYVRYGGGYLAYLFYVVPVLIAVAGAHRRGSGNRVELSIFEFP